MCPVPPLSVGLDCAPFLVQLDSADRIMGARLQQAFQAPAQAPED